MTRLKRNTGKGLEAQVAAAGEWYKAQGLAWLERVEPPQRWVNGKPIIIKPALADFLGCMWTTGKEYRIPVAIECKSVSGDRKSITLAALFPNKAQLRRLFEASDIWSLYVVFEADLGNGVELFCDSPPLFAFAHGRKYDLSTIKPCAYLPNGAPDILGLRRKP
jgi:hypothetical protein